MGRKIRMSCCWTILFGCLGSAVPASGADRPADEILKALDAVKLPAIDRARVSDPSYRQQLQRERQEVSAKRGFSDPGTVQDRPEPRQTAALDGGTLGSHAPRWTGPYGPRY